MESVEWNPRYEDPKSSLFYMDTEGTEPHCPYLEVSITTDEQRGFRIIEVSGRRLI